MLLSSSQLIGLAVITRNGQLLGHIKDLEIDADSSQIVNYLVAPSRLLKKIMVENLSISREQVVEITSERMVIEDAGAKIQPALNKALSG